MSKLRMITAVCGAMLAFAAEVHADDLHDPYLGVEVQLGFAGDLDFESDGARVGAAGVSLSNPASEDSAPAMSVGGAVRYMVPLLRFFALGGRLSVLSWRSDEDASDGRNLAIDLAAIPQLRLPLSDTVELYFGVPVGITLDFLNEFDESASLSILGVTAGAELETDPGVGWNIAGLIGVRIGVAVGFGLFAEAGYALHQVAHDVSARWSLGAVSMEATADLDVQWSQVALNLGVYF